MNTNTETATMSVEQAQREIDELRSQIDKHDDKIMSELAERHGCVEQIGELKRRAGILIHDPKREIRQLTRYMTFAWFVKVPPEIIIEPFKMIIRVSKIVQQRGKPQKISLSLFKKVFG